VNVAADPNHLQPEKVGCNVIDSRSIPLAVPSSSTLAHSHLPPLVEKTFLVSCVSSKNCALLVNANFGAAEAAEVMPALTAANTKTAKPTVLILKVMVAPYLAS
jgi:hypothetical protein